MRGKLLFITGGLLGYVLGARAGRKRYEQIAAAANDLWNAEPVQRRVTVARDFTLDAVGDLPVALFKAARKVVENVQGKKSTTDAARRAAKRAQESASKTAVKPVAQSAPKPTPKPAPTTAPKSATDAAAEDSSY